MRASWLRRGMAARTGFTLIELLVVLALVGMLLTIAVPRYFSSLSHAREVALRENLKVMRACLDKYAADQGRFPETLEILVSARYLRAVPVDPITESPLSWVTTIDPAPETGGVSDIHSGAPGAGKDGVAYADY